MRMPTFIDRFRRGAIALAIVFGLGALPGCQSNTAPPPPETAQNSNGSYPANNPASGLPALSLVDQYGRPVALESLKGKPVLIDFIYARCPSVCPLLTAHFVQIARLLGPELGAKLTMVSVTIDPGHDGPAQLLEYAKTHQADYPGWLFLTGKPADIDALLKAYRLKRERQPDGVINHVATAFLLDADGRQLRMYDILQAPPQAVIADVDRALARG
jgi:protein SCO1/2